MALSTQSDMDEIMERFYMNRNYKPQGLLQKPAIGNGLEADGSMIQSIDGQSAGPMSDRDMRTLNPMPGAVMGAGAGPMSNKDLRVLSPAPGAQIGAQLGSMGQGPMSNADVNTYLQSNGKPLNIDSVLMMMQGTGPMTNKDQKTYDKLQQFIDNYNIY